MQNYMSPYEYYMEELEKSKMRNHSALDTNIMPEYMNMMNNPNMHTAHNNEELNSTKGFLKGNMFDKMYYPYKNMKEHNIIPKDKKEELCMKIMQYNFALTDLCFYLDLNPNDENMIKICNTYLNLYDKAVDEYEKSYGAITLDSKNINNKTWTYCTSPWPWEVK